MWGYVVRFSQELAPQTRQARQKAQVYFVAVCSNAFWKLFLALIVTTNTLVWTMKVCVEVICVDPAGLAGVRALCLRICYGILVIEEIVRACSISADQSVFNSI